MTKTQSNLLYRAVNYGEGDYLTLCFHRGRDGTLVAREDSGRIILLEDDSQSEFDIKPRDVVECIVVCIKSAEPDQTGNRRGGFSIVRAIRIKETAEERVAEMASLSPPLIMASLQPSPEPEKGRIVRVLEEGDDYKIPVYPRLIRVYAVVASHEHYGQVRWHPSLLTAPQQKILKALYKKQVLVTLLHQDDESEIVRPFHATVQASHIKIPKVLSKSIRPLHKRAIILQLHGLVQ